MRVAILAFVFIGACGFDRIPALQGKPLAKTSGDNQAGTAGQALADVLEIAATDPATGKPIENLEIDFAVTGGNGSVADVSLRTDVAGKVHTTLTLGTTAGANAVTVSADNDAEPVVFSELGVAGPAAKLVKGVDPASAVAGATLADPIVVVVEDQFANPVANAQVVFAVTAGNGIVTAPMVTSDPDGMASTTWTLGTKVGNDQVTASTPGTPSVTFATTGLVGETARLVALQGENANGQVASTVALQVAVEDANGNRVPGVTVDFTPTAGGGSVSPASTVTAPDGTASASLTLGTSPGANTVLVSTGAIVAILHATATIGNPSQLVAVSPTNSPAVIVATILQPFIVAVEDAQSNPVPGATVTFSIAQGNGSLSTTTTTADANGHAQTSLTLDVKAGGNKVVAQAGSLPPVAFIVVGVAGPAAQLAILSGNNQSAQFGRVLAAPLVVAVDDMYGNAIAGTTVSFAAATGGGSVFPATAVTDPQGHAQTSLTVSPAGGPNTVTASASGLGVSFAATSMSFASAVTSIAVAHSFISLAVVDLNADNRPDLVVGGPSGISILMNKTSGALSFATGIDVLSANVRALATSDIDGDGKPDLVAVADGKLSVLVNNTPAGSFSPVFSRVDFSPPISLPVAMALAIADLNHDGRPDVVASSNGNIVIALNTSLLAAPSFSMTFISKDITKLSDSNALAIADLDGDGMPDILAGDSTAIHADIQFVFLQNHTQVGSITPMFGTATVTLVGSGTASVGGIFPADLDGDGRMDVMVSATSTNQAHQTVSAIQTSPLTFVSTRDLTSGSVTGLVDLNGDGRSDPIFGPVPAQNYRPFSFSAGLNTTKASATTATFASVVTISPGTVVAVTTGDLNGDGRPDLVAGGTGNGASDLFVSLAQ